MHVVEDEDGLKPHLGKEFQWKGLVERYQEFLSARLLESKKEVYRNGSPVTLYMRQRSFDKLLGSLIAVLVDIMRLTKQEEKDISEPLRGHAFTLSLNLSLRTDPRPKVTFRTPEIRLLIEDILHRPDIQVGIQLVTIILVLYYTAARPGSLFWTETSPSYLKVSICLLVPGIRQY